MALKASNDATLHEMRAQDTHPFAMADHDKLADGNAVNLRADPELEGLTLYEKKAVLVNRELDRQGMGKCKYFGKVFWRVLRVD